MTTSPPLPLPVRLFRDAMQRQLSLDAYATTLGVNGDELRALLTAQTHRIASETLARVAAAYEQDQRQVLAALTPVVATETFSVWLGRQMEGVTQSSLRARTQIAAPLLRAFVSGKVLPDSDQAERLARALYVDRGEMAHVIVADMTTRVERTGVDRAHHPQSVELQASSTERPHAAPTSDAPDAPAPGRTRRRRQSAPDVADRASAPAAPLESAATPAPTPSRPPVSEEAAPADPPSETSTGDVRGTGHRRRTPPRPPEPPPAAAEEVTTTTSDAAAEAVPALPLRKRRQAQVAQDAPAAVPVEMAMVESDPVDGAAPPAPARTRRRRAAPPDVPLPAGGIASPAPAPVDAPPATSARPRDTTDDGRRANAAGETPLEGVGDMAVSLPLDTPPTIAADVVPSEMTLHLSPDEVRLIRLWRRLHPHGRRATLQYIGSLLVEE